MADVFVIATGVANLASVMAAWRRLGLVAETTTDAATVHNAPRVMLPGVGSFGAAMQALEKHGMAEALRYRWQHKKPLMAICVGLQVLAEKSEESDGARGVGIIPHNIVAIPAAPRLPQFGWNDAEGEGNFPYASGFAYFANSYCLPKIPAGWQGACVDYGSRFVAAMSCHNWLACQFHPELSGPYGARIMTQWVQSC